MRAWLAIVVALAGISAAWADTRVDYTQQLSLIRSDIGRIEREIQGLEDALANDELTDQQARNDRRILKRKESLLSRLQDQEIIIRSHFRETGGRDDWDPTDARNYLPYTTVEHPQPQVDDHRGTKSVAIPSGPSSAAAPVGASGGMQGVN